MTPRPYHCSPKRAKRIKLCLLVRQRIVFKNAEVEYGYVSMESLPHIYRHSAYRSKRSVVVLNCRLNRPDCIELQECRHADINRTGKFCILLAHSWYSLPSVMHAITSHETCTSGSWNFCFPTVMNYNPNRYNSSVILTPSPNVFT